MPTWASHSPDASAMTDWDWSEVDQELGLAAGLGSNTIRTVVDYGFSTDHPGQDWTPQDVVQAYCTALSRP